MACATFSQAPTVLPPSENPSLATAISAPSDSRKPASDSSRVPRSLGWTTQWTLPARQERHASHDHEFFLQTTGTTAHQLWLGSIRLSFPAVRRGWMAGKEFRVHGSTCLQESSASRVSTEKNNCVSATFSPTEYQLPVRLNLSEDLFCVLL